MAAGLGAAVSVGPARRPLGKGCRVGSMSGGRHTPAKEQKMTAAIYDLVHIILPPLPRRFFARLFHITCTLLLV